MIFKILKGIPLFEAIADSMDEPPPREPQLLPKKFNIIKSQIYGSWSDEKVKKKNTNKKYFRWLWVIFKFYKGYLCFRP